VKRTSGQELAFLKQQASKLSDELTRIKQRIDQMEEQR
jgi:hypothetical protein